MATSPRVVVISEPGQRNRKGFDLRTGPKARFPIRPGQRLGKGERENRVLKERRKDLGGTEIR